MKHLFFSTVMAVLFLPFSIMGQDLQQNTLKNKQQEEIETIRQRAMEIRDSLNEVYSDKSKDFQKNPLKSSSTTSKVLDSLINNKYNYSTQVFESERKTTFKFDQNGRLLERFEYKTLGTQWIEDEKLETVYDNNGNIASSTTYRFDENTGQITGGSKMENVYDSANNLTQAITLHWDTISGQWVNKIKLEQTYDSTENLTLMANFWWRADTQEWLPTKEITYNAQADILTEISYLWYHSTGEFYRAQKEEYIYNAANVITSVQVYSTEVYPVTWALSFTQNYTYNSSGLLILKQSTGSKTEYTYHANGNLNLSIDYYWDNYDNEWVKWDGYKYNYDSQNRTTYRSHRFYDLDGSINYESVWQYAYDSNGNRTLYSLYEGHPYYLRQEWQYEYTYDQHSNLTQVIYYDWEGKEYKYDYAFDYQCDISQITHPYDGHVRVSDTKYLWSFSDWGNANEQSIYYYSKPISNCPTGDITFSTQQEIDDFAATFPNCTEIEGGIFIEESSLNIITNLNGLSQITSVGGDLQIDENNALTNLTGLNNITSVGGSLIIGKHITGYYAYYGGNSSLLNLTGLENVAFVGGDLEIGSNYLLTDITALNNITAIGGGVKIINNGTLPNLTGLNNVTTIGEDLFIGNDYYGYGNDYYGNPLLSNLTGFEGLTSIGGRLSIEGNSGLMNLTGLENLTSIGSLRIGSNDALTTISSLQNISTVIGDIAIKGNDVLASLSGLDNINSVDDLIIEFNNTLANLTALENLNSIGGNLQINYNSQLNICNIPSICDYIENGGTVSIGNNASGCNTKAEVEAACMPVVVCPQYFLPGSQQEIDDFPTNYPGCTEISIIDLSLAFDSDISNLDSLQQLTSVGIIDILHSSLMDLSGLHNLTTVGSISIGINYLLNDISALENVDYTTITSLSIFDTPNLSICNLPNICEYLANGGSATISANAPGCDSVEQVQTLCTSPCTGTGSTSTDSLTHIFDEDLFIDGIGFANNPSITFTDPATPANAVLSDISLELYFRLNGNSCENEIAIQITDPAGNTQALTAYTSCDGGTGLYYVNLDIPTGNTTGSTADWIVEFDDTNDQNTDYEYSVRFARLNYVATTGGGEPIINEVSDYADSDLFIDGVGFENNPTYTFYDPGTPDIAELSDISLELYFRLNGNSCENEIAIQLTDPAGNTQPLTAYTTCDGGTGLYYVNLDVPSANIASNSNRWTVQFDDTNDQNSDYEYSVRFGRLTYTTQYNLCDTQMMIVEENEENTSAQQQVSTQARQHVSTSTPQHNNTLKLYPVPATQYLNVEYFSETNNPTNIEIISNEGKILMQEKAFSQEGINTSRLDIAQLPAGHYHIRIYNTDGMQMQSFIKIAP